MLVTRLCRSGNRHLPFSEPLIPDNTFEPRTAWSPLLKFVPGVLVGIGESKLGLAAVEAIVEAVIYLLTMLSVHYDSGEVNRDDLSGYTLTSLDVAAFGIHLPVVFGEEWKILVINDCAELGVCQRQ